MIPKVPVLVSICRVVAFGVLAMPVEGPWVWLDDVRWVGCAALVCRARVEAVVEGGVYGIVAAVGDPGAELLAALLNLEDEDEGRRDVVAAAAVEAGALEVFSSVTCGLSVTLTGVVVRKTSVTSTGVFVREVPRSDVLLLTVGGPVVRPNPTLCSLVWDETPSVPSWF